MFTTENFLALPE